MILLVLPLRADACFEHDQAADLLAMRVLLVGVVGVARRLISSCFELWRGCKEVHGVAVREVLPQLDEMGEVVEATHLLMLQFPRNLAVLDLPEGPGVGERERAIREAF